MFTNRFGFRRSQVAPIVQKVTVTTTTTTAAFV
jgi:hypothetical protein